MLSSDVRPDHFGPNRNPPHGASKGFSTMPTNRRIFLTQSASSLALAICPLLPAETKGRWYQDTLYARNLPKRKFPDYRFVFSLNSKGLGRTDHFHRYEPSIEKAFTHLRAAAEKWNSEAKDPEFTFNRYGIHLLRAPKLTFPGTYGYSVAYAKDLRALETLQILLTKLELPTRIVVL